MGARVCSQLSVALILLGGILAGVGGWGWFKLQKIRDKKETVGLERDVHELATMTAVERTEKMQFEVVEEFDNDVSAKDEARFMERYAAVERKVANRLGAVVGLTHSVLRDRRAGESFIDILLEPKTAGASVSLQKHYLIEVKVRRRITSYSDLKSAYLQLQNTVSEYRKITNVLPNSRLLIVVQEYEDNAERIDRMRDNLKREFNLSGKHSVVVISDTDLDKISDVEFSHIMGL